MKDGNYLRASDIFEIILKEFPDSPIKEEAKLGLGDSYFLSGDWDRAQGYYKELIETNPGTKLKALAFDRLSQVGFRRGDNAQGQEFPLYSQSRPDVQAYALADTLGNVYYTVQVGAFANEINAKNITQKLIQQGYPAYIEESLIRGQKSYRVKVGKTSSYTQIQNLEERLSGDGYPTKVCP
jgi:tetratricopeptide (TPR) repeat protein